MTVAALTTVGHGDKTPKTTRGRIIAITWMPNSIVFNSTVSKMSADRVAGGYLLSDADLAGKRLPRSPILRGPSISTSGICDTNLARIWPAR